MAWAERVLFTVVLVVLGSACTDKRSPSNSTVGGAGGAPAFAQDCETLCDATIALGCDDEHCAPTCTQATATAGPCTESLSDYVACLAENAGAIPNCFDYPPPCEDAFLAFASCSPTTDGCGQPKCDDPSDNSCSCWSICSGTKFTKVCSVVDGGFQCSCAVEEDIVAECFETALACHVTAGCCAPFISGMGGGGMGGGGMGGGGMGGGGMGG